MVKLCYYDFNDIKMHCQYLNVQIILKDYHGLS